MEGDISLSSFPSIPSNTADQLSASIPSNTAGQPSASNIVDQPSASNAPCDIAANGSIISHVLTTIEQPTESLRKSSRIVKQPLWLQNYVTTKASTCAYPISYYVSYDQFTSSYKTALTSYSSVL